MYMYDFIYFVCVVVVIVIVVVIVVTIVFINGILTLYGNGMIFNTFVQYNVL